MLFTLDDEIVAAMKKTAILCLASLTLGPLALSQDLPTAPAHPPELLLNKSGTTLFVFISIANQLQVVDTSKREVLSTWPISSQRPGDAAFDESNSRAY